MQSVLAAPLRSPQRLHAWRLSCLGPRSFLESRSAVTWNPFGAPPPLPGKPLPESVKVEVTVPKAWRLIRAAYDDEDLREMALSRQNHADPKDGIDAGLQDFSPYDISEIVKDRLWRVRYQFADKLTFTKDQQMIDWYASMNCSLQEPHFDKIPENMRQIVRDDLEAIQRLKQEGETSQIKEGATSSMDMFVVKLDSGGLLLYNPCCLHPEMVDFLAERGEVKWLLSPDCLMAQWLPKAVQAYPDAKLIASETMAEKMDSHHDLEVDYIYSDEEDLPKIKDILGSEGVPIIPMLGECTNQPACILAHGHLIHNSLIYGNLERDMWVNFTRDVWEKPGFPGARMRIHYYQCMSASPNRLLPPFKFLHMDPTTYHGKVSIAHAQEDGSSSTQLAASIRELLKLDFEYADDIYSCWQNSMPPDDFRTLVDASWNWLDGESLL